jgi:hypothetical protein
MNKTGVGREGRVIIEIFSNIFLDKEIRNKTTLQGVVTNFRNTESVCLREGSGYVS